MPYEPLKAEPYPPQESWFLVVWLDEQEAWCPTRPATTKPEALKSLRKMREADPDRVVRLVRENRFYTTEED